MTFSGEQKFSVQTGCDLVHMESTKPGLIYAILKNPTTQEFFFCGMKLRAHYEEPDNWWEQGEYEEYNVQEYYGKVTGVGLDKATMFACHHSLPYLFYSVGKQFINLIWGILILQQRGVRFSRRKYKGSQI